MLAAENTPSPPSTPLPVDSFDYFLPPELIAQQPLAARDQARLMVVDRTAGSWEHATVRDLPQRLRQGDLLIVNDTRVIPARVRGETERGVRIELLLLHPFPGTPSDPGEAWVCIGKPGRRLLPGTRLRLGPATATVVSQPSPARYLIRFEHPRSVLELLDEIGEVPLPPYIRRPGGPSAEDVDRYQTIFAARPGAVAAPTAGLHFTASVLADLAARGIQTAPLTLHVGAGTFLPIRCGDFREHSMEPEWFEIPETTAQAIHAAKGEGRRVVAIGTTATRALEAAGSSGSIAPGTGWARMFIVPGHRFQIVDALFTNFHLPASTLLLLVSAFAGTDTVRRAYAAAVEERYRFYSFGDAMLLQ